jgi:uncharacterized LabA/DUF88 family protein
MSASKSSPAGGAKKAFVFVDNSNLWIEGKKVSGRAQTPWVESDYWYRIEAGELLVHVLAGRSLAAIPYWYGSVPPPNDTVWKKIRGSGFDVKLFERNIRNKEKGLDMEMGLDMNDLSRDVSPAGTIIIVAGDADYVPVVERVQKRGWFVEAWYWGNAAEKLVKTVNRFENLDDAVYVVGFRQQPRAK